MLRKTFNNNWSFFKVESQLGANAKQAKPVQLPHDAMILEERTPDSLRQFTSGYFQGGTYCYIKKFFVPQDYKNKVVYFEFEGVSANATVFINNQFAGRCPYAYTNFYIQANRCLEYGMENEIKVIAKVSLNADSRWYTGGGIYRNVKIIVGDLLHIQIDGVRITTPQIDQEIAAVEVSANIEYLGTVLKEVYVHTCVKDRQGNIVAIEQTPVTVFSGETIEAKQRMYIETPKLWSTDNPELYYCEVQLLEGNDVIDEYISHFGIRELKLDKKYGLRINGESIELRGGCIHLDNGVIGAIAIERTEERRIEIMKSAGFNAIRSAHQPISKEMLDACDRMGMLVVDEAFDVWRSSKTDFDYSLYFDEWWEFDVEQMVKKDFNHPSVIMYSIGNEIAETCQRANIDVGRKLAEKIRTLDKTRYVLNSVNGMRSVMAHLNEIVPDYTGEHEIITVMTELKNRLEEMLTHPIVSREMEESLAIVDIAGYNYMAERYESDYKNHPNRMIIGSETYPGGIAECWKKVKRFPNIIGDFTWTGWDFIGEAGVGKVDYSTEGLSIFGPYPWYLSYVGDIDITGYRRPISYWREIVWGLRKKPYIAVIKPQHYGRTFKSSLWSWSDSISTWTWTGYEYKPVTVEVYSDAEELGKR